METSRNIFVIFLHFWFWISIFFSANFHVIFQIIQKFSDIIEKSIGIFVFLADPKY